MPHKHNHIKHGVDPEMIRQYLAGELDDKAMHILERRAMDDPFLAEALEGFGMHTPDQEAHLSDLESRLTARVQAGEKRRMIPVYYRWAAAAAVLILAGIGTLWIWQQGLPQGEIARTEEKQTPVAPGAVTNESGRPVVPVAESLKNRQADAPQALPPAPLASNEGATAKQEATIQEDTSTVAAEAAAQAPAMMRMDRSMADNAIPSGTPDSLHTEEDRIASSDIKLRKKAAYAPATVIAPQSKEVSVAENSNPNKRQLQGKVVDASQRNVGLAGVSVGLEGGRTGTLTDGEGNFTIAVDSAAPVQLSVYSIGYEGKKMNVGSKENDLKIALKQQDNALSETVVVNPGKIVYKAPAPMNGVKSYEEYLAAHTQYPPTAAAKNIKGKVRISFMVLPDGTLKDFKVTRKLQPECDQEAIRVIKEGPQWAPASDRKAKRVYMDVLFPPAG